MLCAISGEIPQTPVASNKTGNVYEKRLIESYISENGTEPTTGDSLTLEDLIDLKTSQIARPRPPTLTSIPSLLGAFQEEWDALALEAYALRQNLAQTRQELSVALYQNDAAVRVIARLTKERDEAREALSKIDVGRPTDTGANGDDMQVDVATLPDAVIAQINTTQEKLSKTRRKRPVPDDWATSDEIASYKPISTSNPTYPGARLLSIHDSGDLALIGGVDSVAGVFQISGQKIVQALKGSGGTITGGVWAGSKAVICTSAGKVKVCEAQKEPATFDSHSTAVTGVALHPSGTILASVGEDGNYILYDLTTVSTLRKVNVGSAISCARFHPDGHLLAAGCQDGQIRVFDVKSGDQAAAFDFGSPVETLVFSENGYWLAAVAAQSTSLSIWDLRKMTEVKAFDVGVTVDSLDWDYTGQYLLAAGPTGLVVYQYLKTSKDWSEVLRSQTSANGAAWGPSARSILLVDSDRAVSQLSK